MGSLLCLLPAVPFPRDAGTVPRGARRAIGLIAAREFPAAILAASLATLTGTSWAAPTAAPTAARFAAPPTPPPTADVIRGLIDSSRFAEAEAASRSLLAREERHHGPNSVEVADALDLLGESLRFGGKGADPEAREVCERAVRINETARGPDDLHTARSLTFLGILLFERSQYADAGAVLRRALDIRERVLGPNDKLVAQSLEYLAVLEYQAGRDSTAMPLIQRAIQIDRATLPPDDPKLGDALNVLASLLYYQGDFTRAGPLYEQVLDIYLKAPKRNALRSLRIATCHQNLGSVYGELQESEPARRHLEEALELRRRTLGSRHPLVGSTLTGLAGVLEDLGDVAGARARYEEALRIQKRAYGAGHSDLALQHSEIAWTLMRLGRLEAAAGRYPRARTLLQQALGIQERTLGESFPDLSWTLSGLATVEEAQHHPEAARESYERALRILERAYGPVHPDRIRILNEYAGFLARAGDSTRALDTALRSATARARQLQLLTRGLAERQALRYLPVGAAGLDLAIGLAARGVGGDSGIRDAWDALIHSRTLVLDEMASRQNIAAVTAMDSGLAATFRAVDSARRLYAGLLVRGAHDEDAEQFRARLDRARENMERAERALAATSLRFRADEARAGIGLEDVIGALPSDAALVAFAECDTGRAESYGAFIGRPGSPPCLVSLGRAADIDAWIDRWLREIVSAPPEDRGTRAWRAEASCREVGAALRRRIWDPIAARLGPATRVFVVPDGSLYRVNFAALPADSSDYLVDTGPLLHELTSERDLVQAASRHVEGTGLLAFGGPSFDRWDVPAAATDAKVARGMSPQRSHAAGARGPLPDCPDFRTVRFEPLPGAVREVEEIAALWPDPASAETRTGARASESELKRLAPGRRVLHLATHGFFLDAADCAVAVGRRGIGGVTTMSGAIPQREVGGRPPSRRAPSPLRLSGLALAGANLRNEAPSGDEDGVLTAEEVASLDLAGADWAVLSACDTGVGRVQTSEGVLGLRRAFRIAGARTVIMSLWSVDDQATLRWMKALYQARFRERLETAEAVREAGRSVLREQRAQARSTHPFLWAGFVAAGDWK